MFHKKEQKAIKQNGVEQEGTCVSDRKTKSAYLQNMKTHTNKSITINRCINLIPISKRCFVCLSKNK